MKRLFVILITVFLLLTLFGCTKQEAVYTVSRDGITYIVDTTQKTISDGTHLYHYQNTGNSSSVNITIQYPNGASYWYAGTKGFGQSGWSDDYLIGTSIEGEYVSGDVLVDVVQENMPKRVDGKKIIVALILIALGVFEVCLPGVLWHLRYGWRYKNAEPSDAALIVSRIGGVIVIIAGILFMLR